MKKINWGTRIALLYIGFVAGILTLVTMSMNQRVDLVTEDYYAQELAFQKKIEKVNRTKNLTTPLRWQILDGALQVQYPTELSGQKLSGTIHFYCPADNRKDADFSVNPDSANKQLILLQSIQPGRYLLQFDWKNGETTYWNEGVVSIMNNE